MADTPYVDLSLQTGLDDLDRLALKIDTETKFNKILSTPMEREGNFSFFPDQEVDNTISENEKILEEINTSGANFSDYLIHPNKNVRDIANGIVYNKISKDPFYTANVGGTNIMPYSKSMDKFLEGDFGFRPERDNEDFYYRNEYLADNWFLRNVIKNPVRFLGRVIVPAVLKLGEGLGYVGSMIGSVGSDNYWADVADNAFSTWLEGLEQDWKDKVIPVYKQAGFDDKGFFSKLHDWTFWNESVADGVAFLASAAVPGMGFAKLGTLGKFGAAFSATSRLGKLASNVGMGSWAELSSWTFNTAMEASVEGAGVFKEMTRRLKEERAQGINDLTDDQIRERAGKLAGNTVAGNFAVLGLSNAFENTLFFKPFKGVQGRGSLQLGDDFVANAPALQNLERKGLGAMFDANAGFRKSVFYGKQLGKGFAMEGLWEENAQLAIQRINQGDTGDRNFFQQLGKQTADAFSGLDPEAAESIGLGAIIGMGAGAGFSKVSGERRTLINNTKAAVLFANTARQNLLNTNDIYQRDNNNQVVFENGEPKIDQGKLLAKQRAYTETYGKLSFANKDEYKTSPVVQFETKRALANYVRSLTNVGINDVQKKFSTIDPQTATLFGLDGQGLNEQASEFGNLALSFEQHAKDVADIRLGTKPAELSNKDFSEQNEDRKAIVYSARTDNTILSGFITDEQSKLLKSLNANRNLNNASLADYTVEQINELLYQKKANQETIDDKESFNRLSDVEKQYYVDRSTEIDEEIERFKANNTLSLESTRQNKGGFYVALVDQPDGTKKQVLLDPESGSSIKKIAEYKNAVNRNTFVNKLLSDPDNGYDNYLKLTDTAEKRKNDKDANQAPTPSVPTSKKYRELQEGDFSRVNALVAKIVFGENQVYSPEEMQLRQNYAELIEEMIPQYEGIVEDQRVALLKQRIADRQKVLNSIAEFVKRGEQGLQDARTELEILREELGMEANGKRADQRRITKAIKDLEAKIRKAEDLIEQQSRNFSVTSEIIKNLEANIVENNFRGLNESLNDLKEQRDWNEALLEEQRGILATLKDLLKRLVRNAGRIFGKDWQKNFTAAYSDGVNYMEQVPSIRERIEIAKGEVENLEKVQAELDLAYGKALAEVNTILTQVDKIFRARYQDLTKAAVTKADPQDEAIAKGLTSDAGAFPAGVNTGTDEQDEESGFDGDTYQRPLATKFFTTTFPFITDLSKEPKDVQDYFQLLDFLTNPANGKAIKEKLGKGKLKAIVVNKNNVEALKLQDALKDRAEFFKIEEAGMTHFEIIPVIEDGGYQYYVDADLNRLGRVGEEAPKGAIVRRSLRTVKFTAQELEQYTQKYTEKDINLAMKAATDWRASVLKQAAGQPIVKMEFTITRGIPAKQKMQDGGRGENPVVGHLVPENQLSGQTVRVFSDKTKTQNINGEYVVLTPGVPFIYTSNGQHAQLHAANNMKLSDEQITTVTTVFQELLRDHQDKVADRIEKDTSKKMQEFKEKIEAAGGLSKVDPKTKKDFYLYITSQKGGLLFNANYANFLSSIVHFGFLEKGVAPHRNQIYFRGSNLVFGDSGISIDIHDPSQMQRPDIKAFLQRQFHNIKYFPDEKRANRTYIEYFAKNGKIQSRTWKNYSTYLLSEKNPDGSARQVIPITTSIKTEAQHKAEVGNAPYYKYVSRGITVFTEAQPTISKKQTVKETEPTSDAAKLLAKKRNKTAQTEAAPTSAAQQILQKKRAKEIDVLDEVDDTEIPTASELLRKKKQAAQTPAKPTGAAALLAKKKAQAQAAPEPATVPDYNEDADEAPFFPGDEAFRIAQGGMFKTEADLDSVIAEVSRVLPQFPIVRLKKAIQVTPSIEAWGQFVDDNILIYEGAEEGTLYHEVFEAVVNKILSDAEWNAMSKEFTGRSGYFTDRETGKRIKYSEATDHQVKEELAEEFRRYKLGQEPKQKQTRSFFKIIWDFIKSLFAGKSAIDDIFNSIDKGKFADNVVRPENRFAANYRIAGVPVEALRDLYEGATASMFKYIFYRPGSLAELDEIDENDESIYENVKADFVQTVQTLEQLSKSEQNEDAKARYIQSAAYINRALGQWSEFVADHKNQLKHFRIRFQEDVEGKHDVEDTTNRNDYLRDVFKTDGKRSASKSVRFLFGTLLQLRFDQKGAIKQINGRTAGNFETLKNSVFMRGLVGYDEFMLRVLEQFEGLNDFSRIEDKLIELSGIREIEEMENPEERTKLIAGMAREKAIWTSLYSRLFGFNEKIDEESAWNLKVKFHNYISKHSPDPYIFINGGGTSVIISSVKRGFYENITRKIESSISTNSNLILEKKRKDKISMFVPIKAFREKIDINTFSSSKYDEKRRNLIKFLGLNEMISPNFEKDLSQFEKTELNTRLLAIRNALTEVATPTLNLKQLDIFGYTSNLINFLDTRLGVIEKTAQVMGINNEMRQRHITPSFVSRLVSEINNVKTRQELETRFPQIAATFAQDSILLQRMFDEEGNRTSFPISLGYIEGVKDLEEEMGTSTGQLEFVDKYYQQFNASLQGLYYSLPADSETEWVFNLGEFVEYSENIMLERGDEIINEIFLPKLKTELDLMIEGNGSLLQLQSVHESTGYSAGESLRFFKNILSQANDKNLLKDIHKAINEDRQTAEQIITSRKFLPKIKTAIRNYLNSEINGTIDTLQKQRLLVEDGGNWVMTGLNNSFVDKYRTSFRLENGEVAMNPVQMRSLVEYQKLNTIIGNMEQFKIVFGDPAQYKDWEKRAKSLFGPVEQTFADSTGEFNSWLNNNKNLATLGGESIELPIGDMFRTNFGDTVKARTVNDLKVTNVETVNDLVDQNSDFVKKFIGEYEESNEADGQSIGTLEFGRHLMIKSGWRWTKAHEAYYQYDTALMRQELSKDGRYKYTDNDLKELDNKIVSYYQNTQEGRDTVASAALSPNKTLMPFVDKNGYQHLFKHSIHFMSYQVAKEFELLDLYIDMLKRGEQILNFKSVEKVGLQTDDEGTVTNYYADPFTKNNLVAMGNPVVEVDMRTIGIQVETQTSGKGQTLGSQVTKDINLNLFENGVPTDFELEEEATESERIEAWIAQTEEEKLQTSVNYAKVKGPKGTFTTLQNLKMKNTLDTFTRLGVAWNYSEEAGFSYDIKDLSKIRDFIHDELRRLEVDENTVENIELTQDLKAFRNPAETAPSYTTIANLLWSMADKAVTSMKVNGKPYIQVSSAFFNKSSRKAAYKSSGTEEAKEGFVRLFRGETSDKKSDGMIPDWVRDNPDFKNRPKGSFFSLTYEEAKYYDQKFGTNENRITYIDIPKSDLEKYRASSNEGGQFSASGMGEVEFFVPSDISSTRKPYLKADTWITVNTKAEYDKLAKEGKKLVMTSSELKFYRKGANGKTLGMEIYLPHIYKHKLNIKRQKMGLAPLSDQELMKHLNKNPKLLEGVGFRIPTQATSSIEFFTIKGFLPEAFGSAVVVPSGIVTKAGSDFDVDKLSTYLNNWKIDKDGLPYYEEFRDDKNSTVEERYIDFIRSKEREFGAISREMRASTEYSDVQKVFDENRDVAEQERQQIGQAVDAEKAVFESGLSIFRQLPLAVKQQYFEKEIELKADSIEGAEKALSYLAYTENWIKAFTGKEKGIKLQLKEKQDDGSLIVTEDVINADEVLPIFEQLTDNYRNFLQRIGITNELISTYLENKLDRKADNQVVMADFRLQIAKIVAEFNGYPSLERFRSLPMFMQNTKGAVENQYFESIRTVLEDPKMFEYLLSPNSVEHIRNMRNEVYSALEQEPEDRKELDYTKFLRTEYIAQKRNEFTKGKYDIGIFAVAMTNFANSQVAGIGITAEGGVKAQDSFIFDTLNDGYIELPFEDVKILNIYGKRFIPISRLKDKSGALTMDKLSAYINGAVDVAKEPLIVEMGMHTELAGVYTLMERMGMSGKTTALFLYQPAIREYLTELLFLKGTYGRTYFGESNFDFAKNIQEYLANKYMPEDFQYDPNYRFTDEQLITMIKKNQKGQELTASEKEAQYYAIANFLKMKMYSNHLLETIQGSNHDTASVRSPYVLMKKDLQMERSKEGNVITKVNETGVDNGTETLRNETSIRMDVGMLKNFDNLFSEIGLFALQRENPKAVLFAIAGRIYRQNPFITNDNFVSVMREYEAAMIDSLGNKVQIGGIDQNGREVYNELWKFAKGYFKSDVDGNLKSTYEELKQRYPGLFGVKRVPGVSPNFFLQNLEVNTDQNLGIDLMELKVKPTSSDVLTRERITQGLLQLATYDKLGSQFEDLAQFYRMVVYGSFIQFGIKFSRRSFLDLIPVNIDNSDGRFRPTLSSITKTALQDIDNANFASLDEQVQRSKAYKKNIVPEQTQFSLMFVEPSQKTPGKAFLNENAKWRAGKSKPPAKISQIFFGRADANGDVQPFIHPTMIWSSYEDDVKPWDKMPAIIKIPAVKPEYLIYETAESETGEPIGRYTVAPIVYQMMKRGDYSYMFFQLFKKVGLADKSLARKFVTKANTSKKSASYGRKSVTYLYKPINNYGSFLFNEMVPLRETDSGEFMGARSIIKRPYFEELEDIDIISRVTDGKLLPVFERTSSSVTKPLAPAMALAPKSPTATPVGPRTLEMTPDNIVRIAQGTKTSMVATLQQSVKIGIKKGETQVRMIGGNPYNVTNRGSLTIQEAGGMQAMLTSEGLDMDRAKKNKAVLDWLNGTGRMFVYDIKPADGINPPDAPPIVPQC